jgi:hypothetical protein
MRVAARAEASRRAAWAQVYRLRERVAELEAQVDPRSVQRSPPVRGWAFRDGRFQVEAIANAEATGLVVRHVGSRRALELHLEAKDNPDILYGSLSIADGPGQEDDVTFLWDSELRLAAAERIGCGWETRTDMTGTPSLEGEGDWGRSVELYGATRDDNFTEARATSFLEWGRRSGVSFNSRATKCHSPSDARCTWDRRQSAPPRPPRQRLARGR